MLEMLNKCWKKALLSQFGRFVLDSTIIESTVTGADLHKAGNQVIEIKLDIIPREGSIGKTQTRTFTQ